ncbi:hypothetical protein VKT23_016133 [Stygiomarasmius scandens]|uniref:Zn(2)-C6 fungal-type domain-containing protein n=1 Tax=Marasmiellus scandens TaxID=2682957 RepID=A0ABR1IYD2_9AGAR
MEHGTPDFRDRFPSPPPFDEPEPQCPVSLSSTKQQDRMLLSRYQRSLRNWQESQQEFKDALDETLEQRRIHQEAWRAEKSRLEAERLQLEEKRKAEEEERQKVEEEKQKVEEEEKRKAEEEEVRMLEKLNNKKKGKSKVTNSTAEVVNNSGRRKGKSPDGSESSEGESNNSLRGDLTPCARCKSQGVPCTFTASKRQRTACDRCHNMKVSCSKALGKDSELKSDSKSKSKTAVKFKTTPAPTSQPAPRSISKPVPRPIPASISPSESNFSHHKTDTSIPGAIGPDLEEITLLPPQAALADSLNNTLVTTLRDLVQEIRRGNDLRQEALALELRRVDGQLEHLSKLYTQPCELVVNGVCPEHELQAAISKVQGDFEELRPTSAESQEVAGNQTAKELEMDNPVLGAGSKRKPNLEPLSGEPHSKRQRSSSPLDGSSEELVIS